jgi:hypothetical protein
MRDRSADIRCRAAVIILGLSVLALACGGIKERPQPGGTCDLSDGRQVPVGAVFSDGCNCCLCLPDYFGLCQGAGSTIDRTPCRNDDDCAVSSQPGAWCVFDQGCSPGQGHCVSTYYDICPLYEGEFATDYCGCDGKTFTLGVAGTPHHPDRPYAHLGKCP